MVILKKILLTPMPWGCGCVCAQSCLTFCNKNSVSNSFQFSSSSNVWYWTEFVRNITKAIYLFRAKVMWYQRVDCRGWGEGWQSPYRFSFWPSEPLMDLLQKSSCAWHQNFVPVYLYFWLFPSRRSGPRGNTWSTSVCVCVYVYYFVPHIFIYFLSLCAES